jgi:hypothetical protein
MEKTVLTNNQVSTALVNYALTEGSSSVVLSEYCR